MFTRTLAATIALLAAGAAFAGPTCKQPKDQWMKEADFKKSLADQGYTIKTFKVTKGQCYEIYFDPVTAAVLEQH